MTRPLHVVLDLTVEDDVDDVEAVDLVRLALELSHEATPLPGVRSVDRAVVVDRFPQ